MRKTTIWIGCLLLALGVGVVQVGCFGGGRGAKGGGPEVVEGGVVFRFYDPDATRVNVAGDFNNWSEWTLFYDLPPGVYEYKFVIDGTRWIADPENPEKVSDGFDGENSVLRVGNR
ncbi:MAG: glycogen-binding domain-containing protein [bacterium]